MKFKLIPVAAAAMLSTGAIAQSSVTLYGVLDAGIEYKTGVGKGSRGGAEVRMMSGGMSGSRWGLRGMEDLGRGLKGVFVLESGFNIDDGKSAQASRLFGRKAYVGLAGNFGEVTLGRQETPFYAFGLRFDPMALANYSLATQDGAFAGRADNAIKYVGTFSGLTVNALYSFGANTGGGGFGEVPGQSKIGAETSLGLTYATGPLAVGVVFDQTNVGAPNGTYADLQRSADMKTRRAAVGASYAFGPAKAFAGYRWAKAYDFAVLPGTDGKNSSNLYWLGLGYQILPAFSMTGAAYYQDVRGSGADPWTFVVSADYAFSKRTDVYWNMSYAANKNGSSMGVGASGIGGSGYGTAAVGKNQFGTVIGLRHKF
ncbi:MULTISPECIES: porin [unclassified Cupriavidus]|uniref:porin n=1 Tax=Cupriavidus sp. H19C3 TaxID=3241603 RepID=UPI003BF8A951